MRWLVLLGLFVSSDVVAGRHTVVRGETLEHVARAYGCTTASVLRANNLDTTLVPAGTIVRIPACTRGRPRPVATADIRPSGTDGERARRALAVIDRGAIARPEPETAHAPPPLIQNGASRSVGQPWSGRIYNPRELPAGVGYTIRRPENAFGADYVVDRLQRVIAEVRSRHPHVHTLAIGDLSDRDGGKLDRHHSHQSGLDVDIGLYYKKVPKAYPSDFANANSDLDLEAMWTMITAFARNADQPTGVQVIFLDYHIQARLYHWARKQGVSRDELAEVLQYPREKKKIVGLVRHWRNHYDHLHVRFKSPSSDR